MGESEFVTKLLAVLRARGAHADKFVAGPYSRSGVHDIKVCYQGRYLSFECKDPRLTYAAVDKKYSQDQRLHARSVEAAGGITFCGNKIEDFLSILDEIDRIEALYAKF